MKKSFKLLATAVCLSSAIFTLTVNQSNSDNVVLSLSSVENIAYGEGSGGGAPFNNSVWGIPSGYSSMSDYCNNLFYTTDNSAWQNASKPSNSSYLGGGTGSSNQTTDNQKKYGGYEPLSNDISLINTHSTPHYKSNGSVEYEYTYDYVRKCTGTSGTTCHPHVFCNIPSNVDKNTLR
ncbi:MAG: hypothetical protein MJ211_11745 [Bacteroidales bacterium]|nr:hypothetical protein [Bacteroidales bacterium]